MPTRQVQLPDLHPTQRKIASHPARFRVCAIGRQWGKALWIDTPIPTPHGFKTMGDLQVGDIVYDDSGEETQVTLATDVMYDHDCYEVLFSDGSRIIADAEHQWITHDKQYRKAKGRNSSLPPAPQPITTYQIFSTVKHHSGENNHAVLVTEPVVGRQQVLPIDPYLLGIWLGDGSSNSAEITSADYEVVQAFKDAGYPVRKKQSDKYGWLIADEKRLGGKRGRFSSELFNLNLMGNKHIPSIYLRASVAQRTALLQGLMDSDGYIDLKNGACEFCNKNETLANQTYELICSLGIKARMVATRATLYKKDCGTKYRVRFTTSYPVFRLERKRRWLSVTSNSADLKYRYIVAVRHVASVPVKCIRVDAPSHMYLAGQSFIPTHNTLEASEECVTRAGQFGLACWWIAPDFNRTKPGWKYLSTMARQFPGARILNKDMRIEFESGGYIQIRSADDPSTLRGDTLDFVVLDEAAFMKREAWEEAVRPMLTVRRGGALFISTPYGRNWFWELWNYADTSGHPDWKAFRYSSWDNPYQPREELQIIKDTTPDMIYLQEYMAEFVDENALVFRGVKEVAFLAPQEPIRGHVYVGGVDWGGAQDYTVLSIADISLDPIQQVALYRFNETGYEVQKDWMRSYVDYYNPTLIVIEENSAGRPVIEALQKAGMKNIVPFNTNGATKAPLIEAWRLAIERKDILLLRDDVMVAEHQAYEARISPSGNIKYDAPRGMHDDTVMASALMWYAAKGGGATQRIMRGRGIDYSRMKTRSFPTWRTRPY